MTTRRQKFDLNRPDAQQLRNEVVHGAFLTEGTMVAFPPCFPGMSVPPPADECRITAMDVAADGFVYAGTGGRLAHLLVGMFHGVTGMVFDMGTVPGMTSTAAICCGRSSFVAALNGPGESRLVTRKLQPPPFDLIQEWGFVRGPLEPVASPVEGEAVVHMVADAMRDGAIGVTATRLFRFEFGAGEVRVIDELPGRGRLARLGEAIVGFDGDDALWRYDVKGARLQRRALRMPAGRWDGMGRRWARDERGDRLYVADDDGRLFSLRGDGVFSEALARVPVPPVGAMAVTFDGRVFGTYGEGISKVFCYDPRDGRLSSLGVAVSVLERRRYGYAFGEAVTGRDGQIMFGEDDDFAHLWLYFPRIGAT